MNVIGIKDILTDEQIAEAMEMYKRLHSHGTFARECAAKLISPNIEAINAKLGQENDPRFIAYAIEYFFTRSTENDTNYDNITY